MHITLHTEETKRRISETKRKQKIVTPTSYKKGYTPWNKGKKCPWVSERNRKYTTSGEKHHNWQGEFTTYRSMHRWVVRHKGQPTQCIHCKKDGLTRHQIHWANVSREYRRDVDDYIRLCAKCHKAFDKK